jgi:hypothetical protein
MAAEEKDIFEQHAERWARKVKIGVVFLAMFVVYTIVFMLKND